MQALLKNVWAATTAVGDYGNDGVMKANDVHNRHDDDNLGGYEMSKCSFITKRNVLFV